MSLSLALTQISIGTTLDAWWSAGHAERVHYGKKARDRRNDERRMALLKCLLEAGRPVPLGEISALTGLEVSTISNLSRRLVEDGDVRRVAIKRERFLEAV